MGQTSIKELRNQKGWSQGELAEMSGLSVKTIQRVENGRVEPSLETAKALGSVFDTSFSEFIHPKEASGQPHGDIAASEATTSPPTTVAAPDYSFLAAKSYLRPILVVFPLIVSVGFLVKISWEMMSVSGDVATILALGNPALASIAAEERSLFRSNLEQETGVFSDYYGDYVTVVLQTSRLDEGRDFGASLIENRMLRDIARIISAWERTGGAGSDIGSDIILRSNLQCYREVRDQSDSAIESIDKMQNCIYRVLSQANWRLNREVDLVLKSVAREMQKTTPFYRALRVEPIQVTKR